MTDEERLKELFRNHPRLKNSWEENHKPLMEDFISKIKKHLPLDKNLDILILKGHLLIEWYINQFISKISLSNLETSSMNLTFRNKIDILDILGFFPVGNEKLRNSLLLLNKIRNQLAHRLKYEKDLVDKLINLVPKNDLNRNNSDRAKSIRYCITYLAGYMSGLFEYRESKELNRRLEQLL